MLRVLHLVLAGKGSCLPEMKALQGITVNRGCTCPFGVALKRRPPDLAQSEGSLTPAVSQKISAVRP